MTVGRKNTVRMRNRASRLDQIILQCMALVGVLYMLVFYYAPMYGVVLAFKDYKFFKGILGSDWVGLKNFAELFSDVNMRVVMRNTILMSLLKIAICFPAPILFAVLLSEFQMNRYKRIVQTASYFPHFISWVIISLMMNYLFTDDRSLMNTLMMSLGLRKESYNMLNNENAFYWICVFSEMWKEMGWSSIIFLAAISGIDANLYEAAMCDGAGRLKRIWHITLPGIKGAVITVLILSIGSFLGGGMVGSNFEQSFLMGNNVNNSTSEIIQTYAFKMGMVQGRFSYATAVDLIQSLISITLVIVSNFVAKRVSGEGLF